MVGAHQPKVWFGLRHVILFSATFDILLGRGRTD